jgi:ABC-type dipeptide/oligopeptide/nickel transport system permease subunit
MVSENASGVVQGYPLAALSAGICIVAVVIAFSLLGQRLHENAERAR